MLTFILTIVEHTPKWVWLLLVALLWLGIRQMQTTQVPLPRLLALPVAMGALSLSGLAGAFGLTATTLLAWAAAWCATVAVLRAAGWTAHAQYDRVLRRFTVPGSVMPLLLILVIFCFRYAVGVTKAMSPELLTLPSTATVCALAYGAPAGAFAARSFGILRSRAAAQ